MVTFKNYPKNEELTKETFAVKLISQSVDPPNDDEFKNLVEALVEIVYKDSRFDSNIVLVTMPYFETGTIENKNGDIEKSLVLRFRINV